MLGQIEIINCEQKTETAVRTEYGKYMRWIEQDPV
jgi:hypothetical protein